MKKQFDKNNKILIIGFGSIGERHYHNLIKLGYKHLSVYDVNKKNILNNKHPIFSLNNLKDFDIVFICSPNHIHVKHALIAARAGCHLFIEKPLSHSMKNISQLIKLIKQQKIIDFVGSNMRFHPCLAFIKKFFTAQKLGQIYAINHEVGYYLPYWRPRSDYRQNYAAKKSTGGGIIFDAIHEFDLLFWLNNFSPVKKAQFIYDKVSDLQIQTEDICVAGFQFKNNIIGSVRCDYLQKSYSRSCKVVGEFGNLEWDWQENIVWLKTKDKKSKIFQAKKWQINDMYLAEVKYFLNCVENKKQTFNNVKTAKIILAHCLER